MGAIRTRYLAPTIPICTLHWTLTYLGTSMYIGPHTCMFGYVSAYHGVGKLHITAYDTMSRSAWSFIKTINGDTTMTMLPTRSNRKPNATGSTEKHDDFHSAPRWQDNKNRKTSLPSKSSLQLEADFRERRVAQLLNYSHDYSVKMFFVNAEHKRNYTTYDVTCALHSQNDFGEDPLFA